MRYFRVDLSLACAVVLAGGMLLPWPTASAAENETALEGREVVRIDVDVPAAADATRIREVIRVRVGDAYRKESVQKDIAALYALGEFADVRVEAKALRDGVLLIYHLRPRPIIQAIRFKGTVKFSENELRDLLDVTIGETLVPYKLRLDLQRLRLHYREQGYVFAHVEQDTPETEGGVDVVYRIEAGAKVRVESVQFEGNEPVSAKDLRKAMVSVKPAGLLGKGVYRPELLRSDLLAVQELLRRRGYLDATVGHEIVFGEAKERAYIVVRVRKGSLYTVDRIVIRGAELFLIGEIREVMGLKEGAPFSQEQIAADVAAIRRLYGRKGHIRAKTDVARVFAEGALGVTLRLTIDEGPEVFVNRVIIRGNRLTKDHVVRREISLLPGDLANLDKVKESKRDLYNTGYFRGLDPEVGEEPVRIRMLETEDPTLTDVLVELSEGRMGELQVGGGWSSSLGPVGYLVISHRNFDPTDFPSSWQEFVRGEAFVGAGQKLVLSLTPGANYRDYRLSWTDPSVADSPYSVGFDIYLRDFSWRDYDDARTGVALHLGREFLKDLTVTITQRIEDVEISGLSGSAPADVVDAEGSHARHSIGVTVSYDKRDNVYFTTTGYRIAGSIERAGSWLGGDVDCLRETIEVRRWWTVWDQPRWGKHVVNVGGEIGAVQDTGSDDVPIFERFFIGGIGSLRGFKYRRVGPVDETVGRHIGGEYKAVLNTEYEAPLVKDTIRWVVFLDAGVLEPEFSDLGFSDLRASVGVGLRFRLPVLGLRQVPMGLYLATPIRKESSDDTEAFSFSIGTGFEF